MRRVHCAVWAVIVACSPVGAATLYRSDFPSLTNGSWAPGGLVLSDASYELRDGWLWVTSEATNAMAILSARHDGDGTYRATVRNARSCHWCALLAKGVYRLEVNNEFVRLALYRKGQTGWRLVGEAADYIQWARDTQQFELRLSFVGNKVSAFLDDKRLLEYEDPEPTPPGGEYGLLSGWGSNLAWRDISLTDQPDLSEWPYEPPRPRAPADLVQVTWVRCTSSDSIYFDGETAGLRIRLSTRRPDETPVHLRFALVDVWQHEVAAKMQEVVLTPGTEQELTVEFAPPGRGCFKVALEAATDGNQMAWVEDLGSFTVVSRALADMPPNPRSYFGGHMDGINYQWHFRVGRKLGIQWARCHDMLQQGWWTRIQPDGPDQWLWPYDEAQKELDVLGLSTLGEFCWTPTWASSARAGDPGNPNAYPPRSLEDFARFVRTAAEHYRGSIRHWEVWNEPQLAGFFRGTAQDYAKLLQVACREVKQVNRECMVIGGGGISDRDKAWITALLEAGGAQWMDAFSIHYLEPDLAAEFMPWLQRVLNDYGMRGPIWNTEAAVYSSSFLDQLRTERMEPEARYHFRNACFELVRMYMENLANGIERVFYYEQADPWRFEQFPKPRVFEHSPVGGTMWDEGRMLKPIAAAHAALAMVVEGRTFRTRITRGDLQAFIFEGPGSALAVQYARLPRYADAKLLRLPLPEGVKLDAFTLVDVMGNERPLPPKDRELATDVGELRLPLGREPRYVVCRCARAGDVLRAMYGQAEVSSWG